MNINALSLNQSAVSILSASSNTSSASKLTEEEKKYDVDDDGTLSVTEKAAMEIATSGNKTDSTESKSVKSVNTNALKLEISQEGWRMLEEFTKTE